MKPTTLPRLFAAAVLTALIAAPVLAEKAPATATPTPESALTRLVDGNKRFVTGSPNRVGPTAQQWSELAKGQHPFAIVLTCADSRLSPEIIFDQGLGELFVIRNAGNVADDHVLGSIEYAVEHLHVPLIIVLGHTKCGAVTAAVDGGEAPGHIKSIVESLSAAVSLAKKKPGDPVDNAVRISAKLTAANVTQSEPILKEEVKAGHVKVLAARYDIATGQVEFYP